MTIGPWKHVKLETYSTRLSDVYLQSEVSESLEVSLKSVIRVTGKAAANISVVLKTPEGLIEEAVEKLKVEDEKVTTNWSWPSGHLKLWYPINYGDQPLYTVEVQLFDEVRSPRAHASLN